MARWQPPPKFIDAIRPMLLTERPFELTAPGWLYEIKYDGYRCLAEFGNGTAALRSRSGGNMTQWFPEVVDALAGVPGGPHVADGEVAVVDDLGRSDFEKVHARALKRRWVPGCPPVVFCAFDVLVLDGVPVMGHPLGARKAMLAALLARVPSVLPVGYFDGDAQALFDQTVVPLGLEGLVAKRVDSRYVPGTRSKAWVKVKREGICKPGDLSDSGHLEKTPPASPRLEASDLPWHWPGLPSDTTGVEKA